MNYPAAIGRGIKVAPHKNFLPQSGEVLNL